MSPAPVAGRVSMIVPTRNSARTMRACLEAARSQDGADVEVIVVDNASTDATVAIATEVADRVEQWGPERSAQRNRGAAIATGEFLVFLDSDQVAEPRVAAEVVAAFAADETCGALVLPELSYGDGFLAECRAAEKRLYLGDRSVEAGRAFRRAAFDAVGGFDETLLAGPEDFDFADRVEQAGWGAGRVHAFVWHDEGRVSLRDVFRKKRYYGASLAAYLVADGTPGHRLGRPSLRRWPSLLVQNPAHAAGLAVLKLTDGLGLALGALSQWRPARS